MDFACFRSSVWKGRQALGTGWLEGCGGPASPGPRAGPVQAREGGMECEGGADSCVPGVKLL